MNLRKRTGAILGGVMAGAVAAFLVAAPSGAKASDVALQDPDPRPVRYKCAPLDCLKSDGTTVQIWQCDAGIMPHCNSSVQTDCEYECQASG